MQTVISQRPRRLQDLDTGEFIEAEQITKISVSQKAFWKVYLIDFLQVLGVLDSKQVDVLIYILEHTQASNNTYIGTYRKTAEGSGVAVETVRKVMRKLLDNKFIQRVQNGVYQISPLIMMKGNEQKKALLLNYYNEQVRLSADEELRLASPPDQRDQMPQKAPQNDEQPQATQNTTPAQFVAQGAAQEAISEPLPGQEAFWG